MKNELEINSTLLLCLHIHMMINENILIFVVDFPIDFIIIDSRDTQHREPSAHINTFIILFRCRFSKRNRKSNENKTKKLRASATFISRRKLRQSSVNSVSLFVAHYLTARSVLPHLKCELELANWRKKNAIKKDVEILLLTKNGSRFRSTLQCVRWKEESAKYRNAILCEIFSMGRTVKWE